MYCLTTISSTKKASVEVYKQLNNIIGDIVRIRSYCIDDFSDGEIVLDDFILITAPSFKNIILKLIPNDTKYIISRRSVDMRRLKAILKIPEGSKVLVVNDFYGSAVELANELRILDINKLELTPFDPDRNNENDFEYAITAGEISNVPSYINNKIDLGDRLLSIMTITEILYHFNEKSGYDDLIITRYLKDFIDLSLQMSEQNDHILFLKKQLEEVISNVENGIIITDKHNIITFCNERAKLVLSNANIEGRSLFDCIPENEVNESINASFINLKDSVVYLTRKEIYKSSKKHVFMYSLEDVSKIQIVDEQYRYQKKHLRHTAKYKFSDIVYKSRIMEEVIKKAKNFAKTSSTVLITGESGTGKELLAQAIHNESPRREAPFVAFNCAALSETLLESELFGYEEGAFTGAKKEGKKGLFEMAHKGTIFLDEIGDAPLSIQSKLLRVIQEKEIMRISGDRIISVDVRIIAATNKDLRISVENRMFRKDLYYRLKVLPIELPSLKERKEDIDILLKYLLCNRYDEKDLFSELTNEIYILLNSYDWPGNIRELNNIVEYIVNTSKMGINLEKDISQMLKIKRFNEDGNESLVKYPNNKIKNEALTILSLMYDAKQEEIPMIGRKKIKEMLKNRGVELSEQQIKSRLELLNKNKMINSYVGKGTLINKKGEQYLKEHEIH